MSRSLHREAEHDLGDATRYYETEAGAAVANRFLNEFVRVADLLEANPGFGTHMSGGRRIYPLRGFPYSVIYRVASGSLRVLVARHQSRNPEFGGERA